ncbi:hypothetical protein EV363DRAFT_1339209, partial [Boletus edulis]
MGLRNLRLVSALAPARIDAAGWPIYPIVEVFTTCCSGTWQRLSPFINIGVHVKLERTPRLSRVPLLGKDWQCTRPSWPVLCDEQHENL